MTDGTDPSSGWDALHEDSRYRPAYPSEPVVRFISRRFGGVTSDAERAGRILDLGCGAGRHSALIAASGHHAFGVDRSLTGLRHARASLGAAGHHQRPTLADMAQLPFADASVDGVVAYGVINYTTRAGMEEVIQEIHRVLKVGGWAHVVTRTDDDHRFGGGPEVGPGTFVLDITETNEGGMLMHFLSRAAVDEVFAGFADLTVDRIDHSAGGGAIKNSDWVIEARR